MKPTLPVLALLTCFTLNPVCGQVAPASPAPEPAEITQFRQQFGARALSGARTLSEQFANALGTLAKEAGVTGDYETALKAQRRREELAELFSSTLNEPTLSNVMVLRPADARVGSTVSYDRAKDVLLGWKTVGCLATWDVPRVVAGRYDVTITYAVAEVGESNSRLTSLTTPDLSTGGDFEFYEDSSLTGASANRRTGSVSSTGGWDETATLVLPAINLTRSSARLGLKITRTRGSGGVMHLKEIRLTPAKATGPAPAPELDANGEPIPQVDAFTALQKAHHERMRQTLSPIVTDYSGKLTTLAAALTGDADAADELRNEVRRVERQADNPQALLAIREKNRPASALPDGVHEMADARFVAAPSNTGDKFMVTCNGEQFPVRLLWVACAPPGSEPLAEVQAFAQYFSLSTEDTVILGHQARDFTAEYLKEKPLRLLTRGVKDAQGALLVSVNPEGMGDYAGVLVDNGLAMISKPVAKTKAARIHEDAALGALLGREAAARARIIPPGAWARSEDPSTTPGT